MSKFAKNDDGSLPAVTFPGCYPLVYITADGGSLCPSCANGGEGSEAYLAEDGSSDGIEDAQWQIENVDVHWEGNPVCCDHCYSEIESAYGRVEG